MRIIPILFVTLLMACAPKAPPVVEAPNRWSDERLLPVLEAQEHRSRDRLCDLLNDSDATVREAAALALASVRDTTSVPCLLRVLNDASATIRSNAAFALGYVADSVTVQRMAEKAANERDTLVQRSYLRASFIAMQRNGLLEDANAILYFFDHNKGADRVRAADALRRLPDSTLRAMEADYLKLVEVEADADVKATLIRGLTRMRSDARLPILRRSTAQGQPLAVRVNAIRALAATQNKAILDELIPFLSDSEPMVRTTVLEELHQGVVRFPKGSFARIDVDHDDPMTWIPFYGLLLENSKQGQEPYTFHGAGEAAGPYARAELMRSEARKNEKTWKYLEELRQTMLDTTQHSVIRQAAFGVLAQDVSMRMMMPRAISGDMQVAQAAPFYHSVFGSGDVGLICAVAEQLQMSTKLSVLFSKSVQEKAMAALHPLRDLEARQLLLQLAARRDGLPAPPHQAPSFNHPIDIARLRNLKQGQRYRIVTTKGEIILATDVNECPGSSLAFDSLVMAGYYNGKAFHRMVPNFVVQGGCPRGDGYGGMPWTLRTEIGRTPFTAGSIGLASAGPDTESCQFFITHSAAPHLDGRYTRFGEVVSGMDVVWTLQVGDLMERIERTE